MFDVRCSNYSRLRLYANSSVTSDEVDSGYYPPQMERRDWSDSFVYVTIFTI